MKVAYLCHRIPYPPDKGDKIRAFHQLRAIAERHEVDLFTLADDPSDLTHEPALAEYCRRIKVARLNSRFARLKSLPHLLTSTPLTVPYFYSTELDRALQAAIESRAYDRIVVYCSAMAQYISNISHIPIITDFVDVDSDKWTQYAPYCRFPLSAIYEREGRCLREYEKKICEVSTRVIVTTDREARLLRDISPTADVRVITNGVDTEFFRPFEGAFVPAIPTMVFTGDMRYFPNEQAALFLAGRILPLVRQSIPRVRLLIVGRNPNKNVQALGRLEGVEVTGFVPDVRTYLAQAQVSVAPFLIAAGIPNKVLEAMSFGLPVVGTARAVQGLTSDVAAVVETGETVQDLSAKIIELLSNPDQARRIGMESRRRVACDYNWDRPLSELLALLDSGVSRKNTTVLPASLAG